MFIKFRFISERYGETAGLVLPEGQYKTTSILDLSCFFPLSERKKMEKIQCSPVFPTWGEAFNYIFEKP